ncbi:MAG TPA: hypothetical protein P5092_08285 [Ruminococcus sp.]|nr:hypothetical protein [Ruminococcus sp.]
MKSKGGGVKMTFKYIIYWKDGGSKSGSVTANSKEEAEAIVRGQNSQREIISIAISKL